MDNGRFEAGHRQRRRPRNAGAWCLAAALAGAASAVGCAPRAATSDATETFRLGSQGTTEARTVLSQFMFAEPLLAIDWQGRPAARLAIEWQWLNEGRTFSVRLRPDVKFHDGTPLTGPIVAAILRQQIKDDQRGAFQSVAGIETPDDYTLLFRLSRPDAFLVEALAGALIVDENKPDIGTGPFKIVSRTPLIQAEKYTGYYRGTPGIDRVEVITYDTQRAVFAAMMRGKLDMVQEVNPESVEFLEGASRFEMYSSIRPYYIPLVFNLRHPILGRVEVRRALAEAIDRDEIVQQTMRGHGQVADDPVWPFHWAYNRTARTHTHDPIAARARLDAAGLPVRTGTAGAMASRFQIHCLFYNKDFQFERIALLLQRQLAEIGVDLVLEGVDQGRIMTSARTGDFESFGFLMAGGKSFDWIYRFWHSPTTGAKVLDTGYSGVDDVLERIRVARTDVEIRAAVADLRQRFHDDVPAAFLAWPETTRAVDVRFDIGDRSDPEIFANMWRWRSAATQKAAR
jgi:peptide/nickel transport system substrate-binding protein